MRAESCVIHRLAEKLAGTDDIRAIFLDGASRRISFASLPGSKSDAAQQSLQEIAGDFLPEDLPECAKPPWRADCKHCTQGATSTLPKGIRLVTLPGTGVFIERDTCATAPRFWRWKQFPWVRIEPIAPESIGAHPWKGPLLLALICGFLTLAGWLIERFHPDAMGIARACYIGAYLAGGWHAMEETWELLRKRILDIHFLMLAVAVGAAVIGHWWEGAVLLFLFSISGALEDLAQQRTERAISSLFKEAPKTATVVGDDGREQSVPVEALKPGMVLAIRPGEVFPVDARVLRGQSASDESNLTGESIPVEKGDGDPVLAGTLNLWGRLDCQVTRPSAESALARIIRLIQEARESKAPAQRFTDRFGSGYTYAVLIVCTVMFFVWWKMFGLEANNAFYRAMTLLVVASPCALVLSIPSAVLAGIAAAARRGILFRGGVALEKLSQIRRVALDKTGTLTSGQLRVVEIQPAADVEPNRLLAFAAAIAVHSRHPVAQAIHHHASGLKLALPAVESFRSLTGSGLVGVIDGSEFRFGHRRLMTGSWAAAQPEPHAGTTEVFIEGGGLSGRFLLEDDIRLASRPLLERLRNAGLTVAMLTGDRPEAARSVASSVGLDEFHAALTPEDKVRRIREWMDAGERTAMVGDGVNDAPSLAAAYVGVAMGMRGSDAALEQADVVLMKDRLDRFSLAYEISRRAGRIIRQNLAISLGSVTILSVAAFAGLIPLTIGVIGHEGSTVLVVLNSLRLLLARFEEDQHPAT